MSLNATPNPPNGGSRQSPASKSTRKLIKSPYFSAQGFRTGLTPLSSSENVDAKNNASGSIKNKQEEIFDKKETRKYDLTYLSPDASCLLSTETGMNTRPLRRRKINSESSLPENPPIAKKSLFLTETEGTRTTIQFMNAKPSMPASSANRTQSFEPAWWGNVLTVEPCKVHPHVSTLRRQPAKIPAYGYPPVHTLILGTHPSVASLSQGQYYGHPLNSFWYIVGDSLGFRRSLAVSPVTSKPYAYFHDFLRYPPKDVVDYPKQLERLVEKGFALWDIVGECERKGSLDAAIEKEVANPIREFCEGTLGRMGGGNVRRIVIANGTTGASFFIKHFTNWFLDGTLVPFSDKLSQRVFKTVMRKARKSHRSMYRHFDRPGKQRRIIEIVCVPSVSPAAARLTYLDKREAWEHGCFEPGLADFERWKNSQTSVKTFSVENAANSGTSTPTKMIVVESRQRSSPISPVIPRILSPIFLSSDLAKLVPRNKWVDLQVPPGELRPSATLTNGQCFNWFVVTTETVVADAQTKPNENDKDNQLAPKIGVSTMQGAQSAWGTFDSKEWVGPLNNRVISIRETPTTTLFRVLHGPTAGAKQDLQRYFRLETALSPLYEQWSRVDIRLARIAEAIPGVRILRQEPLECMFSFICSSNNNIPRITKMLTAFREKYGNLLMEIPSRISRRDGGETVYECSSTALYSFPTLESLRKATEEELRTMGLGYRAKYIIETRNLLVEYGGEKSLLCLRKQNDSQLVQEELIQFKGIGRKVADCIALFSLDQDDAIPVDVHVQHIASRDYDPTLLQGTKSLTPTIYKQVGDLFRSRFQRYAGWAHSLLFVAELPSFRGVLPLDIVQEMDQWKQRKQKEKGMNEDDEREAN